MTDARQLSDLDDRIVDLVIRCWNEHRMPLLLSRLGDRENGDIAKETKQRAGSLSAYLSQELADRIRVIQHSAKPPLIGAIPADAVTTNDDVDVLLDQTCNQSTKTMPRFHPAFRAAFRKPLDEAKRRYMNVQAPVHFRDVNPKDRPDGFIEIERAYIVGPDAETAEVQQRMRDWLDTNGIEPMLFFRTSQPAARYSPSNDLLDRLLLALNADDLKRISMPLDIVSKLRGQKS